MSEYHWQLLREEAIRRFGELPNPLLEQDCINVFEIRPKLVADEIDRVGDDLDAGKITSGWPILRSRIQRATATADVTATDSSERDRQIRNAKNWITNAGLYIDRQDELESELFGEAGRLRHHDTPALRAELTDLWKTQRPRAERAEASQREYDALCRESIHVMRDYRAKVRARDALLPAATSSALAPPPKGTPT